jgi:uncharacterized protein YbcI
VQDGGGASTDGVRPLTRPVAPGEVSNQISRTMVSLYRNRLGRGPTKARTTANVNTVMVAFEDTLTTAEQTLVREGKHEHVHAMRQALAETMREEAIGAIEGLVGRKVRAYVSGLDPQANVAVQIFLLEQIPETGQIGVSETSPDGEVRELA